ncbi:MAG: hypothetical protein OHK0011_20290 [Turneriella sp.]
MNRLLKQELPAPSRLFGKSLSAMVLLLTAPGLLAEDVTVASAPQKPSAVRMGAYVDTYYSTSAFRPASRDRQFVTQAARDREFNINLAHVEAAIDQDRVRGRLAVQFGTAVNANYQYEITTEKYSNQFSVRNLQEAYAGYRLFDRLWLDMGIFFGHIGFENWISHNNWNYTRALYADNTPYYATGARLSYEATAQLKLQLHLLNGWQVITPPNRDKSVGTQISYEFSPKFRIIHNGFAGNVAPDETTTQYRFYSNLIFEVNPFRSLAFALSADAGAQKNATNNDYLAWYTGAFYVHWLMNNEFSSALRLEYFIDRSEVLVTTGTVNGFSVGGLTANFDYAPTEMYRLRLEYRNFFSRDAVYLFTDAARSQEHIVTVAASLKM